MENASRALMIAGGVLVGIIILAIAVTLFSNFSAFGRSTYERVEAAQIDAWNNSYTKYYGNISVEIPKITGTGVETVIVPIPLSAHDVVTIANQAMQNNIDHEFDPRNPIVAKETLLYVQVKVESSSKSSIRKIENFESENENKTKFLQDYALKPNGTNPNKKDPIYFKVSAQPLVSSITKRVYYIQISEFTDKEYENYEKIKEYRQRIIN